MSRHAKQQGLDLTAFSENRLTVGVVDRIGKSRLYDAYCAMTGDLKVSSLSSLRRCQRYCSVQISKHINHSVVT